MTSLRAIREIHVRHSSEGAEKVQREIDAQAAANDRLAGSSDNVAKATETTARRQASALGAYDKLRSSIDQVYRAQQQFDRGQGVLDRAFQQGIIDARQYAQDMEILRGRMLAATTANDNSARAVAAHAAEIRALRAAFDPTFAAAERLSEELEGLARLEREGIEITGGYESALDALVLKYDATAQAAKRTATAQKDMIEAARRAQSEATARAAADENQRRFTGFVGVRPSAAGAARDSAAVFESDAAALARLRAELNPMAEAQASLNAEMERFARWARQGEISTDELAQATANSRRRFDELQASVEKSEGWLTRIGAGFTAVAARVNPLLAALGLGFGAREVGSYADAWSDLSARVGLAVGTMDAAPAVMQRLATIADNTYSSLELTAESFVRNSASLRELGLSTEQQLQYLSSLNDALVISGARGDRARQVQDALSKAMVLGSLSGDELNAVLVNGGSIAAALAQEMGTTINGLRQFGADGKITGDVIRDTLIKRVDEFRERSGEMPATLGDAMGRIRNALLQTVGIFDQQNGLSERAAEAFIKVADGIKAIPAGVASLRNGLADLADEALAVGTVMAVVFGRAAMSAMAAAFGTFIGGAIAGLNALRVAAMTNPFGLLVTGIGAAITAAYVFRDEIRQAIGLDVMDIVKGAANLTINSFRAAFVDVQFVWENFPAIIGAAMTGAVNAMVDGINSMVSSATDGVNKLINAFNRVAPESLQVSPLDTSGGLIPRLQADNADLKRNAEERAKRIREIMGEDVIGGIGSRVAEEFRTAEDAATDLDELLKGIPGSAGGAGDALDAAGKKAKEAFEAQARSIDETVASLQRQIDLFDASEGATARAEFRARELARAWDIAREAGSEILPEATIRAIDEASGKIEVLTSKLERMNLDRDQSERMRQLRDEAGLIGMNDGARRIALASLEAESELRQRGIPLNDLWGRSYVENARQIATMEEALDHQRGAFEELRDVASSFFEALSGGEGVLDALAGAFGRFGQQLASKGFDRIFSSLFGDGATGASTVAQIGAAATRVATSDAPVYGANRAEDRTFAAPVAAVERRVLPALTSFSTELTAAAKAIRTIESGSAAGNYSAMGPVTRTGDRAYGAYQVMGNNIADWSRSAIGREVSKMEFLRSVELQDKIFEHRFGGYMAKYGAEGASRAWFAGEGGMRNYKAQDVVGTSVGGYGSRFGGLYNQHLERPDSVLATSTREYQRATASGVKTGIIDANQSMSSGADPWSNMRQAQATPTSWLSPRMGAGLQVAGAGAGAFFGGYSSGSPLGGLLSGGLGGFQAAGSIATAFPALAGMAGPLGIIGGAALGLIGGALGKRQQRREQHKQAAAQWEQLRPQYEAFDQSLSGNETGGLRAYLTEQWGKLSEFMKVGGAAWKMGSGNSTAQFQSTGQKLFDGFNKMLQEFRDGYESLVQDLASGEGLQGAFARGRAATRDLKKQLQATRDDIDIAFGNVADIAFMGSPQAIRQAEETEAARATAIERYNRAAGEYALSLMYTAATVSDVQKTIDGFRGTAAGLHDVFADLGWSADEAAKAIHDRLDQAIANIARGLETSVADQVDGLSGRGYLVEARNFLKEFDTLKADMKASGADTSLLDQFFRLSAQAIVDGAELAGQAFTDLVAMFPALTGAVKEFTETAVAASASEIRDAIKGYEERLFQAQNVGNEIALFDRRAAQERLEAARFGADALAALERALGAERANIAKAQADAMADAAREASRGRYEAALRDRTEAESALRAEYERTVDRIKGITDYLSGLRFNDDASILSGQEQFEEAQRLYRETLFKANGGDVQAQEDLLRTAEDYQREAKAYYATSEKYGAVYREIEATLKVSAARMESELDVARRQASFLADIADSTKALPALLKEFLAAQKAVDKAAGGIDATRDWGINPVRNQTIVAGWRAAGLPEYTGNFGPTAARGAELAGYLNGLSAADRAQAQSIIDRYIGINRAQGGLITGPGTATSDSIRVNASNGEFMMREAAVRGLGVPTMDFINRTGTLPMQPLMMPQLVARSDGALLAELRGLRADNAELREEVRHLGAIVIASDTETRSEIAKGNRSSKKAADALELDAA